MLVENGRDWVQWAQSYKAGVMETHRLVSVHRQSDSARLVWYVAVCGYVIINSIGFLQAVLSIVTPMRIAVLLAPWAIAAILSIAGHIAIVRAAGTEDRYHLGVLASLNVFMLKFTSGEADGSTLLAIVNDTDPKLAPEKARMDTVNRWRGRLVESAQWALLIAFLWSLVALIFSGCLLP